MDRYHDESERCYTWFVDNVQKYHRTVATYLNTLTDNGLTIRRVLEPEAQPEFLAERPGLADESRRPPLMAVVSAQKLGKIALTGGGRRRNAQPDRDGPIRVERRSGRWMRILAGAMS